MFSQLSNMRSSIVFRCHSYSKSLEMEIFKESSYVQGKSPNIFPEKNDHSYLCVRSNKAGTLLYKKLNALQVKKHHGSKKVQKLETFDPFKENVISNISHISNIQQQGSTATSIPVKKKRGRKPGIKRNNQVVKQQIYYSPALQNPGKDLDLIFFKEKEDKVFLRHTSRDVMWSSTLPFQETPEYLELKEMHSRMLHQNKRMKPSPD